LQALAQSFPGLRLVLLFGSAARDSTWRESDVDLAVLGEPGWEQSAFADAAVRALGVTVDLVDLPGELPVTLLKQLLHEGLRIYQASQDAEASWRAPVLWQVETDAPSLEAAGRAWLERVAERGLP
jgi:predicted nucleotidyltransferase